MQRELFRNDSYLKSCSAKIIEILELLEKMTLEEYKEEQKFYG